MAAKKKGGVVTVAMVCSECKATNYFTSINKATTPKLTQTKYCKVCKKHTEHSSREIKVKIRFFIFLVLLHC